MLAKSKYLLGAWSLSDVIPKEVVDSIIKSGPFAVGTLFGCGVTMWCHKVAAKDRTDRQKLEREHEKELLKQVRTQQERIDELHKMLEAKAKSPT